MISKFLLLLISVSQPIPTPCTNHFHHILLTVLYFMSPLSVLTCTLVPLALTFQSATHNIISFIILTNMSISNNDKSMYILRVNCVAMKHSKSKSLLLHRHVSAQWLLSGHMSAQYVLCGHMSVQCALSGQFCWFLSSSWTKLMC